MRRGSLFVGRKKEGFFCHVVVRALWSIYTIAKKGFCGEKKKLFPQYLILLLLHTIILYAFILVRK